MTTHQQSFYERIGFEANQTKTMVLYDTYPASPRELRQQQQQLQSIWVGENQ